MKWSSGNPFFAWRLFFYKKLFVFLLFLSIFAYENLKNKGI